MKRHLQCAEQQKAASNFSKYCACHAKWISWLIRVAYETSFTMRRATGITLQLHHKYCACHAKWISWLIRITYETSFTMRGATVNTLQPHQILRLPRKMNLMTDPHHIWNVIYNARSNSQHPPTLPNMAKWSSWLIRITYETSFAMRGATVNTLQPHQILRLPRKMTTQHLTEICWKQLKRHFQCATDPTMIRDRSETVPTEKTQNWTRRAAKATFRTRQEQILLKITTFPAPAIIPNFTTCCACHEKWHMNFTKCCACHEKWHMNSTKCCACHEKWHMNFTKCCACHAKWISWLIRTTYETSFTMRGATVNTLQPHQILRLPRKMTTQHLTEICWKQLKRHFQCATDPTMIRDRSETVPTQKTQNWTRRAAKATFRTRQEQILLKITTFPAPAIIPNFTTCCACHEKWHMNFTKCCACHEKWHMNSTKCFACHEKWHMNFTKCCACHEKWHEVTHDCYYYYYYYYDYYYYYYYY